MKCSANYFPHKKLTTFILKKETPVHAMPKIKLHVTLHHHSQANANKKMLNAKNAIDERKRLLALTFDRIYSAESVVTANCPRNFADLMQFMSKSVYFQIIKTNQISSIFMLADMY